MGKIYSNPFVHTVYYSRDIYNPKKLEETEQLHSLFNHFLNKAPLAPDFAFNEQVSCSSYANGTFMRLNGCCLLKLRHWCLHPTESTSKRVAQYFARFLSPLAAAADLVINTVLLVFKGIAWIFMRIAYRNNQEDIACLYLNVTWQGAMFADSLGELFVTILTLPFNLAGPKWVTEQGDMAQWGYKAYHYKDGENFELLPYYNGNPKVNDHYKPWFEEGTPTVIPDPQRILYLQDHCGWDDLSVDQMKNLIKFTGFTNTDVAYSHNSDHSISFALRHEIQKTTGQLRYTKKGIVIVDPRLDDNGMPKVQPS